MPKVEDVGKIVEKTEEQMSLEQLVRQAGKELGKSLPQHMRPERVVQIALTCIRLNPELAKCTPASFVGSLFISAQLGLEPVAGNAYLIPFNNSRKIAGQWKTVKEVQFVIGYKGLATLFYRHGKSLQLNWGIVHEKDDFDYQYGTDAYLKHKPKQGSRGKVLGFYVIALLQGGGNSFMYMTKDECVAHGKKHSKTFDKKKEVFHPSSPWATNENAMCLKTVLIQLSKLLPLSMELQRAISVDETSRDYKEDIDSALDLKDNTAWNGEETPAIEGKVEPKEEVDAEFTEKNPKDPTPSETQPKEKEENAEEPVCAECDAKITEKIRSWSAGRYGKALCYPCQNKQLEKEEQQKELE